MAKRRKIINALITVFLFVFGLIVIAPFIWMITVSFDRLANIQIPFPPSLIPDEPALFNYELVFENGRIFRAYMNSAFVTFVSVAIQASAALLGGYAFSKGRFKGKRMLFILVLATMMVPIEARLIPLYQMFNQVNLINTFWPLILPTILYGLGIFLCKQYFDQLPDTLREAARIDGAGEFKTFFRVYLPLAGPITATLVILSFMSNWNEFLWPLVVINSESLQTIPLFLASFSQQNQTQIAGMTMALATMSVLPIIVLFLFLQRYIIQSIALSGIKE
ncbi:maltose/maltodextrin ABC transporter, permease protein MalG [Geomicrobium sp. JCM 19037]|uniref:carbohydrate ABC transporter permease n=1 Tax=Geomicrobium sp. JCM 19037 TaxID=1460634 RepID=UPI00045F2ECA|nr:carbohydrate ABC transporter permease [Geomicrobium sp. JCM 19037]GAK05825.1 maltose/maltodextrin ABC transporter, permease protein MalG [Geomicrobium sp. JCM 19037]